jgi:hypothetical protein
MTRRLLALPVAALLLSSTRTGASPAADTIRLSNGTAIENVQVTSEGLKEVAYKDGKGGDKTVASDTVVSVEYEKKPKPVDEAEGYLLEEDLESAVDALDAYVQASLAKPPAQFKWAPAYAAWRVVEVRARAADLEGVKSAAGRLIQSYPESRYVPMAYLVKASAELDTGQGPSAQKTLEELAALISAQSLAKRWEFECRLGQARADDKLKPDSRRNEYERVAGESRDMPDVQARAQVLVGEAYLAEATANQAAAKDLRGKARAVFEKVIASEGAGRDALAGAYTGLGETLFLQGADADDKAMLQEAALQFLRVLTVYRENGRYVPKALFYAMRCFDLGEDGKRKADMKRELVALYPNTTWAAEAKKF